MSDAVLIVYVGYLCFCGILVYVVEKIATRGNR